jgi:GT2 family glycosyltransferase
LNRRVVSIGEALQAIWASNLFDARWYMDNYADVGALGIDPVHHYIWLGRRLGRRPSEGLPAGADLLELLSIQLDGHDSIAPHLGGGKEVAIDQSNVDAESAKSTHKAGPIGLSAQRVDWADDPLSNVFDAEWYRRTYADALEPGGDPWTHYKTLGKANLLQPNEYLSPRWYLSKYQDVAAAGVDPVDHYVRFGAIEGRSPGPLFDRRFYSLQLAQGLAKETDPLADFLSQPDRSKFLVNASQIDEHELRINLGCDEVLRPTQIAIGIVVYRQKPEEMRAAIRSAKAALSVCGAAVSGTIFVFDNGGTVSESDLQGDAILMSNGRNDGFGRSQNAMMSRAFKEGADCYIGANPDGAFHPDAILHLLKMNQRHKGQALIEAVQFPEEHPKFYHPVSLETEWCSGACFLMPQQVWDATGGFDEKIFLYCEDVDLSWSVRLCGFSTLCCPTALFYHDVSDREYSPFIWKEMLIAGRYLAHKWGSDEFRKFTEDRLISDEFFSDTAELPPLDPLICLDKSNSIANFSHHFSFARARW